MISKAMFPTTMAALLAPGLGAAATLCVDPAGAGGCRTTLQAAVDAAGGGDLIRVNPGTYYESVTIPSGKDALRIVGAHRETVVVDASPYFDKGISGTDPAFLVQSPNVRLRTLTLRNGVIGVQAEAAGLAIDDVTFRGTDQAVITLAPDLAVRASEFRSCGQCILIQAPGAVVQDNVFSAVGTAALVPDFADVTGVRYVGNRLSGGVFGLFAEADEATVRGNDIRYQLFLGIKATGDNPVVEDNTVVGTGFGISSLCVAATFEDRLAICTRATVSRNVVRTSLTYGMQIGSTGPGLVARGNIVSRAETGMTLGAGPAGDLIPLTIEGNQVSHSGFVSPPGSPGLRAHCIEIFGSGERIARNTVAHCTGSGFYVNGLQNTLEGNDATRAAANGFTVDGGAFLPSRDTVLTGNAASFNAAQGIAIVNGAVGTIVTGNAARGNRTDFCDQGVGTIASGNMFGTTGPCAIVR